MEVTDEIRAAHDAEKLAWQTLRREKRTDAYCRSAFPDDITWHAKLDERLAPFHANWVDLSERYRKLIQEGIEL